MTQSAWQYVGPKAHTRVVAVYGSMRELRRHDVRLVRRRLARTVLVVLVILGLVLSI